MSVYPNIKAFFHDWCQRNEKVPSFDIRTGGRRQAPRFICELQVDGYLYTGMGNSTTKKEAKANAAKDFVQFLVRNGHVNESEVPDESAVKLDVDELSSSGSSVAVKKESAATTTTGIMQSGRSVFQPGENPDTMGAAYRPVMGLAPGEREKTYIDIIADQKKVEDAEELDINAGIHGNWTLENCKQRLNQFMQTNRINANYKYSLVGSTIKSYVCELTFFVKQLNRELFARESASNKQTASRSCALSLVRQLFHLGVIDAFTGSFKTKTGTALITPYDVSVDPALEEQINDLLKQLEIVPNDVESTSGDGGGGGQNDEPISLISSKVLEEFVSSKSQSAGIVSWSPPQPNWNPWLGSNIDEGALATSTLDKISDELNGNLTGRLQTDSRLQQMCAERGKLPIAAMKRAILESISEHSVTLIRGNTGCGKTTQVCQYILDDYIQSQQGAYCNIIVTQPRRISAVSVAERIAAERCEIVGNSVGYSVRFDSVFPRPYGAIMFCTVGVLLRKLEGGLRGISHVIVDEIHERDANTDFILIVLRDMVHTYPDLRVVLMSATVDTSLFSKYFNDCPLVQLEGSCYPVTEYYLEDIVQMLDYDPPESLLRGTGNNKKNNKGGKSSSANNNAAATMPDDDEIGVAEDDEENMNLQVSDTYPEIVRERVSRINEREMGFHLIESLLVYIKNSGKEGAVLVFLPGWNYIFSLMRHLRQQPAFNGHDYVILPLHSQLPKADQRKVFESVPAGVTKVILSTNIAETSITINDVVYVIDVCKVKMRLFTAHNNMTSYVTAWASRSNLEQRKGRAGRVCPGVCYHLITKARYEKLEEHLTPEIFRIPLHEVALAVKLVRLGAIGQFLSKAIEAPPIDAVIEAEVMLRDMQCLDVNDELTPLGLILARLPIEPRLGKMLILATIFGVGDALATIASNSSTFSEIFMAERRLSYQQRNFAGSRNSDHLAMLNAFQKWSGIRRRGEDAEISYCENKQLVLSSLRVTGEAKHQLVELLLKTGFPEESLIEQRFDFYGSDPNLDMMVALLCMGMYPNVCYHKEKRKVLTMECKSALIHKLSVNCSNYALNLPSPFFVFGEKVRTRAISCKQTTVVTPIDLLLFGSRKVEYVNDIIRLDSWINLKMNPKTAASIVALRPAIDSLIIKSSKNPDSLCELTSVEQKVIDVVRQLCAVNAGKYNLEQYTPQMQGGPGGGSFRRYHQDYQQPNRYNTMMEKSSSSFEGGYDAKTGSFETGNYVGGGGGGQRIPAQMPKRKIDSEVDQFYDNYMRRYLQQQTRNDGDHHNSSSGHDTDNSMFYRRPTAPAVVNLYNKRGRYGLDDGGGISNTGNYGGTPYNRSAGGQWTPHSRDGGSNGNFYPRSRPYRRNLF